MLKGLFTLHTSRKRSVFNIVPGCYICTRKTGLFPAKAGMIFAKPLLNVKTEITLKGNKGIYITNRHYGKATPTSI